MHKFIYEYLFMLSTVFIYCFFIMLIDLNELLFVFILCWQIGFRYVYFVFNWHEVRIKMSKVRTPKQHRGIQTKNRIMKAAFQLFAKKGIHGTNSKEIVEKAGVSIGSFYSYFKDKKTLLLEMLEDYLDRHYTTIWRPMSDFAINELGQPQRPFPLQLQ